LFIVHMYVVNCFQPQGKAGLFSLLPAPMHTSIKETNRTLIPHTLTKKPGPSTAKKGQDSSKPVPLPSNVLQSKIQGIASYGSDSDESDEEGKVSNFFSLSSSGGPMNVDVAPVLPEPAASGLKFSKMALPPPKVSVSEKNDSVSEPLSSSSANDLNTTEPSSVSSVTTVSASDVMTFDSTSVNQDAPLSFKTSSKLNAPLSFKSGNWKTTTGSGFSGWYGNHGSHSAGAANYNQYQQPEMEIECNPEVLVLVL